MNRMTKQWWLHLTAMFLALAAGCGGSQQHEEDNTGSAQLFGTMMQAITSADITQVRVTVSATGMQSLTTELVKTNGQWSGIVGKLPAGTNRTFTAEAFSTTGTKLYAGVANGVTIIAKGTTTVSITLQEVSPASPFTNAAPVITALSAAPGNVEPGGTVTLSASATDANPGDTLSYAWSAPSGTFAQPTSLSTTWTAPSSAAVVPLTLTVTDSKGTHGKVTFNVTVNVGRGDAAVSATLNTWPQVGNISASATAIEVNGSTTVSTTASDNDGDSLAYSWVASCPGTWANATSATAQFTATALPGSSTCNNCNLTVTITDSRNGQPIGGQTTGTLSICVGPGRTAFSPPDLTETFQSTASTSANGSVTFRVKAVDPQDSTMSFSWTASTGTHGTPTTSATTSEVIWTAPACVESSAALTLPSITATITNAHGLSTTHAFGVTGLPGCGPTWSSTGAMTSPRAEHTATLLSNGKVLVAGGYNSGTLATAEIYDPATGTWAHTGSMATGRRVYAATLLDNGKVLVTGGYGAWASAEVYDPTTGSWSAAGSIASRYYHTSTKLPNGKVLIAGGTSSGSSAVSTAEIYDPATGTWSSTGSMASSRYRHTATMLLNGKVLIAGGYNGSSAVSTAEVYDPATGTWSSTGPMTASRSYHTATMLPNGKVLVAGAHTGSGGSTAELYDPTAGTWSSAGTMASSRYYHTATMLPNGKVLVAGAYSLATAELYTP